MLRTVKFVRSIDQIGFEPLLHQLLPWVFTSRSNRLTPWIEWTYKMDLLYQGPLNKIQCINRFTIGGSNWISKCPFDPYDGFGCPGYSASRHDKGFKGVVLQLMKKLGVKVKTGRAPRPTLHVQGLVEQENNLVKYSVCACRRQPIDTIVQKFKTENCKVATAKTTPHDHTSARPLNHPKTQPHNHKR